MVREEEVIMNVNVLPHEGTEVCGSVDKAAGCVCLRPVGHWGPHVVQDASGAYVLMQTVCSAISFEIPALVAFKAMADKDWTWSAD